MRFPLYPFNTGYLPLNYNGNPGANGVTGERETLCAGLPDNQFAPVGMPPVAWSDSGELRGQYSDSRALHSSGAINSTLPAPFTRELRKHYYGAVSYLDSNVGAVLDALVATGQDENTIKILWGDHGCEMRVPKLY